jgi:hypothetical protein
VVRSYATRATDFSSQGIRTECGPLGFARRALRRGWVSTQRGTGPSVLLPSSYPELLNAHANCP